MSNPFEEPEGNPREGQELLPRQGQKSGKVVTPTKQLKMASMTKHNFQSHNYKRPTFCAHCGNLLVGVMKQGLRCKRCEVDVHDKCQEDLNKPCIELIVGQHNFRDKTYKQPTYCDFCKKLLVGLVNQGLRCSECGTNVHEKCQEKIEAKCAQTQRRKSKDLTVMRGKGSRVSSRRSQLSAGNGDKIPMKQMDTLAEGDSDSSSLFAPMPSKNKGRESPVAGRKKYSPSVSPGISPRGSRSSSFVESTNRPSTSSAGPTQIDKANQMVDEVVEIMKNNAEKMNDRGEKLENLHDNARQLEEKANLFEKKAKEIKKKMWLKNYKMWIALIVAIIIIIAIIVVSVVFANKKKS